jgi:GRAM domain-containing protein
MLSSSSSSDEEQASDCVSSSSGTATTSERTASTRLVSAAEPEKPLSDRIYSSKDEQFRERFSLPSKEIVLKEYVCVCEDTDATLHGTLFISESFVCFSSCSFHIEHRKVFPLSLVTLRQHPTHGEVLFLHAEKRSIRLCFENEPASEPYQLLLQLTRLLSLASGPPSQESTSANTTTHDHPLLLDHELQLAHEDKCEHQHTEQAGARAGEPVTGSDAQVVPALCVKSSVAPLGEQLANRLKLTAEDWITLLQGADCERIAAGEVCVLCGCVVVYVCRVVLCGEFTFFYT